MKIKSTSNLPTLKRIKNAKLVFDVEKKERKNKKGIKIKKI